MKYFLAAISFLLLALSTQAQELRIIKDNINCSYGLKDKTGNWVIEPIYTLIEEYNSGYFLVKDPMGDGLLSSSGKWIINCEYDRIDVQLMKWSFISDYNRGQKVRKQAQKGFFIIGRKANHIDLINSRGKVIREMSASASCQLDDEKYFLIHESSPRRVSYIDTSGNVLIDEMLGSIQPFRNKEFSLRCDSYSDYGRTAVGNVQLIDRNGKILNKEVFDRALLTTRKRVCFERDSKYGVMKTDGQMIIPPNFKREVALAAPQVNSEGWVIIDDEGRRGIMKSNGTILQAPKFDKIQSILGANRKHHAWVVELNAKKGVIDADGKWLIPAKYDKIQPFSFLRNGERYFWMNYIVTVGGKSGYVLPELGNEPKEFYDLIEPISSYNHSYQIPIGKGLIIKKDGKFGLLKTDGILHLPCEYTGHYKRGSAYENQFFYQGQELKEMFFKSGIIQGRSWIPFLKTDQETIFTDGNRAFISAIISKTTSQIVSIETREGQNNYVYGNLFVLDKNPNGSLNIYNHLTSKKVELNGVSSISYSNTNRFLIRTKSNKNGVIDGNGKIIIDTVYNTIQMTNVQNRIWARRVYDESQYKWALLDSTGVQVIETLFDQNFTLNTGDQLIMQNNRTGLMDTKNITWKIEPTHPCLYRMVDDYYLTINLKGKKGIVLIDGTYLVQPIYDTIVLLTGNSYVGGILQEGVEPRFSWLLRKEGKEFLIDQDGQLVNDEQSIRELKKSLFFDDTLLLEEGNQIRSFPVLDYTPSLHFLRGLTIEQIRLKRAALWNNKRLKDAIFDTINTQWLASRTNCNNRFGSYVWTIHQPESNDEDRIRQMCNCGQQMNTAYGTQTSFSLSSIGSNFATLKKKFQNNALVGWDHLRSQAPPVTPQDEYFNFIVKDGETIRIQLTDIFPNDKILMEEFVRSLKKRDDLKLECSSLENMIAMVGGRFGLSEYGVHLYLNQYNNYYGSSSPIELLIPTENLLNHKKSMWIVPILSEN